jgi:hypothetical protein
VHHQAHQDHQRSNYPEDPHAPLTTIQAASYLVRAVLSCCPLMRSCCSPKLERTQSCGDVAFCPSVSRIMSRYDEILLFRRLTLIQRGDLSQVPSEKWRSQTDAADEGFSQNARSPYESRTCTCAS